MQKLKVTEMGRLTPEEFAQAGKLPLTVVLDNVRSRHNIGAVFRTADALLLRRVVLCGICAQPPDAEIHKTALGAELTVSWDYAPDTLQAVRRLQEEGCRVYAVEQAHGSIPLGDFRVDADQPIAIVLGHEVKGVQQAVVDACDGCIEIPQYGTKHSLNVSVAAGIVMYRLAERLRKEK